MVNNNEVLGAIGVVGEQQRLTEQEEAEIQRQRDLLDVQLQFAATLQADLDALRVLFQSAAPPAHSGRPTSGKNMWPRPGVLQFLPEPVSSGDQTT